VEHHDNHNLFEEMMLAPLFISPNIASTPDPLNDRIIDFFEAVWIESPSSTIPCSIRGITVEAQLSPTWRVISCHGTWYTLS